MDQLGHHIRKCTIHALQTPDGVVGGRTDKGLRVFLILFLLLFTSTRATSAGPRHLENKVVSVVQQMSSAFQKLRDYTCDVEVTYFRDGAQHQQYLFKFYFKKKKNIRVDFSTPHRGSTILYRDGKEKATVIPFKFFPKLKFNISVNNRVLKTPAGQRIDQTDMGYFIRFVFENLEKVKQKDHEYQEHDEQITFLLWAMDYIDWKDVEKYRVVISKKIWLPVLIERHDKHGRPLEISRIKNYVIDTGLDEKLFQTR